MKNLFSKLFKRSEPEKQEVLQSPNEEYNVMENIRLERCAKYADESQFRIIENSIYEDISDEDETKYRMAISYELNHEDDQYPLEDILDEFSLYVSDFLESESDPAPNRFKRELAGDLEDLKKAQKIIGKRVFNRDFDDDGEVRVKLVIE